MTRIEWAQIVAMVAHSWPTARPWSQETQAAYFEDVSDVEFEPARAALVEIRRSGRERPPTGGIIRQFASAKLAESSARPDVQCICYEPGGWRRCKARHTEGWAERRAHEVNLLQKAREAARLGLPIPALGAADQQMAIDVQTAYAKGGGRPVVVPALFDENGNPIGHADGVPSAP